MFNMERGGSGHLVVAADMCLCNMRADWICENQRTTGKLTGGRERRRKLLEI